MWFSKKEYKKLCNKTVFIAITSFLLKISLSLERELHFFIKKETPHSSSKRQLSPAQQLDVGSEGKTAQQMEGEIHRDHGGIYSVFQERFGST